MKILTGRRVMRRYRGSKIYGRIQTTPYNIVSYISTALYLEVRGRKNLDTEGIFWFTVIPGFMTGLMFDNFNQFDVYSVNHEELRFLGSQHINENLEIL